MKNILPNGNVVAEREGCCCPTPPPKKTELNDIGERNQGDERENSYIKPNTENRAP